MKKQIFENIKKMYLQNSYLFNNSIQELNMIDIINNDFQSGYLKVYLKYNVIVFDDDCERIKYYY